MINTNYGTTPIRPAELTSARITRGVHGGNIQEVAGTLAQDAASITGAIDRPTRTEMAKDVQTLKTQLWARLGDQQMGTALMAAGAIMGGTQGMTLSGLAENLKSTVGSKEKLDQLAQGIQSFHKPAEGESRRGDDVFHSLESGVTRALVAEHVPGSNVPVALFISGGLASNYAEQGNLAQP